MKKIIKFLLVTLVVMVGVFVFTACAGSKNGTDGKNFIKWIRQGPENTEEAV